LVAIAAVGGALISVPGLIAAAVAAVVALTFNVGGCRDALVSLAGYLMGNLWAALKSVGSAFASLGNSVIAILAPIALAAKTNLEPAIAYISNVASQSKAALSLVISGVTQAVSGVGQAFNGVAQSVGGVVSTLISTLNGMVNAATNSFQGVIGVVNNVKSAVAQAVSAVQNAVPQFFNSGASLMQSFAQGVASSAANAYNAVSNSVKQVRNLLPSSPAKEGPLKDLDKSGQALLGTFAANINGGELLGRLKSILASLPLPNIQGNVSPVLSAVSAGGVLPAPVNNSNESQSVVINYNQTVNVSSQMSGTEIINSLRSAQGQFLDYLSRSEFFKNRKQS
jgi:phage-related protein